MDLKVGEKKQRAEEPAPIEKTSEELDMEIVNFLMNETEGLFNLIDIDGDGKIGKCKRVLRDAIYLYAACFKVVGDSGW